MDRIIESTTLFPLERVPRLHSITARSDGAVSLDDLEQLHTELEKLFGAASLHLDTIDQYLRGDELRRIYHAEAKSDLKCKLRAESSSKKYKDTGARSSGEGGINFARIRELDEKTDRSGTSFLFAALRDVLNDTPGKCPSTNGTQCANGVSSVPTQWQSHGDSSKGSIPVPKKTCYKFVLSSGSVISQDEPITLRVLRSTAHSRRNSVSTASTSSPSTNDESRVSYKTHQHHLVAQSRSVNGERQSNGLHVSTIYDSASRVVGGRLLRSRGPSELTSPCTSSPQRPFSPQSEDSHFKLAAQGSNELESPVKTSTSDDEPNPARRKRGRPRKPRPDNPIACRVEVGAPQNRLFANYRHEVPKAFWRQFDQQFMRDIRGADVEFVNYLRACSTLPETELARIAAACNSHAHSSRELSLRYGADWSNASWTDSDDSPISKRLRLRTSDTQNQLHEPLKLCISEPFRPPVNSAKRDRDTLAISSRYPTYVKRETRNGNAIIDGSAVDQRETIFQSLCFHDSSMTLRHRGDCRDAKKSKSDGNLRSRETASCGPSRAELTALSKLVDLERQASVAYVQRQAGQSVPANKQVKTEAAKRHLVVSTNDDLKIRIRLTSTSSSSSISRKVTPSCHGNVNAEKVVQSGAKSIASSSKRQRVEEIDMNAQMTANLLLCISDTASCEMHLAKLLPDAASHTKRDRSAVKSLSLKTLVGNEDDKNETYSRARATNDEDSRNDVMKPLTVRTPDKCCPTAPFAASFSADSRLLLPSHAMRKMSDSDSESVELQRLLADLRCTNEWNRLACDALVSIATQQAERQPMLNRLRELERTIAELNMKVNDQQQCYPVSSAEIELARRTIDERETIFRKLGISTT